MKNTFPIRPFIRMSAKKVSLRLCQVGRKALPSIRIKVIQCSAQRWSRDTIPHSHHNHSTPSGSTIIQLTSNNRIQNQIGQVFIPCQCILDLLKQCRTNDASSLPHPCTVTQIDTPIHVFAARLDDPQTLCIGAHLGRVQSSLEIIQHLHLMNWNFSTRHLWTFENFRCLDPFILTGTNVPCIQRCCHERRSDRPFRGFLYRPPSCTLHTRLIKNVINDVSTLYELILLSKNG
mmetsp:Transcript_18128/g.30756  ORF Transcript_18128/g.30756 Transcript_18128/m.30756 type:complete len:233 (-) Transcript_18128:781-1479(-)